MARVISISNQKGGVGKTTTAVNLGAYLAIFGKRTLLIDFDPQANATSAFGISTRNLQYSIYDVLLGKSSYRDVINKTQIPNHYLMPSNQNLSGALVEFVNISNREYILKNFVNKIRHYFHYILIDLPPSLNLLTINGLVASDEIIIPVQTEYYSLEGIAQLISAIDLINNNLDLNIRISGAVMTMYNKREGLSRQVVKEMYRYFPYKIFNTLIPRSVHLAEAPSFAKPIALYAPNSIGAKAYENLAKEVLNQEQISKDRGLYGKFGIFNV